MTYWVISTFDGYFGTSWFTNDANVTLYHLPGKMGWDTANCGVPIAIWLPQVARGASFGITSNQFGFTINWADGMKVVVEACTNLSDSSWYPLQTNTLGSDSLYFSDSQWTNYPNRYYRIISQ